jgi:hypothetical protein
LSAALFFFVFVAGAGRFQRPEIRKELVKILEAVRMKSLIRMSIFIFVVISMTTGLTELTALGQSVKHPQKDQPKPVPLTDEQRLSQVFQSIVGRVPGQRELGFWLAKQKTSTAAMDIQILDWFVAPEQAGERLAMVDQAYKQYFNRPANLDEKIKVPQLVQQKRIPFSAILGTISQDFTVTKVTDVAGDPHSVNVTVVNLGPISTSTKTTLVVRFYGDEAGCTFGYVSPAYEKGFEVPPLAPQQSVTVKVTSAKVLQQTNPQRGTYSVIVSWNNELEPNLKNNDKCVPRLKLIKDKVTNPQPNKLPKD